MALPGLDHTDCGKGDVRLVDFGAVVDVDVSILTLRRDINSSPVQITEASEESSVSQLRSHLESLSQMTLTPLIRNNKDVVKRLTLSPDGQLWIMPWSALPLHAKRLMIEDHQFRCGLSSCSLIPSAPDGSGSYAMALIVVDPNFDLDRNERVTRRSRQRSADNLADV